MIFEYLIGMLYFVNLCILVLSVICFLVNGVVFMKWEFKNYINNDYFEVISLVIFIMIFIVFFIFWMGINL